MAYKESGDGGLNYGGQEITELAINIKGSEFVQLIKETISDLFPNAGMTGLNVQAASEAFDVFLESMNVSLTDKLADTIDQVDEVSAALVTAFEDYRQLLDGTITKLGVDWGKDLPVSRFLPTEGGEIIGTEYNEEIFGSSKRDVIDSVGGDDTIYGEAGNDRIVGGSGIDRILVVLTMMRFMVAQVTITSKVRIITTQSTVKKTKMKCTATAARTHSSAEQKTIRSMVE